MLESCRVLAVDEEEEDALLLDEELLLDDALLLDDEVLLLDDVLLLLDEELLFDDALLLEEVLLDELETGGVTLLSPPPPQALSNSTAPAAITAIRTAARFKTFIHTALKPSMPANFCHLWHE